MTGPRLVPLQSDAALLADIAAARDEPGQAHLWWLGQSGFLLQWRGRQLLFDPYLSDSLTVKYAHTDRPHVRMTERVVDPAQLAGVDVATSSHNHTDHLDADTLGPLLAVNPGLVLVVPAANVAFAAERLSVPPERLTAIDDGQCVSCAGFDIHAVPAAHETVERDELGRCRYLGYVVEFGGHAVYHSGDTVLYDGMVDRLSVWRLDVALLPINGRSPQRRVAGNLWGREAALLAHHIGARVAIPCHFEMFEFNTATPDEFLAAAAAAGQAVQVLRAGQRYSWYARACRTQGQPKPQPPAPSRRDLPGA
jgi:L-ascorbate metabolism protein UlaG (beta-lactamase superfamily)